jgi:hypothetical protein
MAVCQDSPVIALVPAGLSIALAAAIGLAGYSGGWVLALAAALVVLCLAAGWGALLDLPAPTGSGALVALSGLVSVGAALRVADTPQPLSAFAGVLAGCVLAAFAHELLRRDGRADLVKSVTGTLAGQVLALLAGGWVLLPATSAGRDAVLVAACGVAAARLAGALPWPRRVTAWAGFAAGVAGALTASAVVSRVSPGAAAAIGLSVAGSVAALDRLFAEESAGPRTLAMLAAAAAPVAAAGTVGYAAVRLLAA